MESASAWTTLSQRLQIAIVGAGWAGLAAAITATQNGHQVTLLEASKFWGGRARSIQPNFADHPPLDNGQHILIGAYQQTLSLMQTVGINLEKALWRRPLDLRYADGSGLSLPNKSFPLNLLQGIAFNPCWSVADKWQLLKTAWHWQGMHFECAEDLTVADLCKNMTPTVWQDLMEPLCVSALNTPAHEASGKVFLRIMKDALFGPAGSSDLLLPRLDLGQLFPNSAIKWLEKNGAACQSGQRIDSIVDSGINPSKAPRWQLGENKFDHLVIATPAWDAAHLLEKFNAAWATTAQQLKHETIATVYVQGPLNFKLPQPMLALRNTQGSPAQFAFDRGQIYNEAGTPGLLAFVVSANKLSKDDVTHQVMGQLSALLIQLGEDALPIEAFKVVQTVVEKRATFACTPNLKRPSPKPCHGITVCGDYVEGPYPATLEGAVISGIQAVPKSFFLSANQ
jgi:squalene-associated FAD-dependent desaturase